MRDPFGVLTLLRASMPSRMYSKEHQDLLKINAKINEDRCKLLKWPTLSDRRIYLSLVEGYKIVIGFYHLKFEDFFDFATTQSTRANHEYKLYVKPARLNCYKHSFFI